MTYEQKRFLLNWVVGPIIFLFIGCLIVVFFIGGTLWDIHDWLAKEKDHEKVC